MFRKPIGGWRWNEFGQDIVAHSLEELKQRIEKLRRANNAPIGDIEAEVAAHYAVIEPSMVRHSQTSTSNRDAFRASVERWLFANMKEHEGIMDVEVKDRVKTCLACPHNKAVPSVNEYEDDRYKRSLIIATKNRTIEGLGGCTHFNHDNNLAVLIKNPHPEAGCCGARKTPDNCWI